MHIHFLQHSATDFPALIDEWTGKKKISTSITHIYRDEALPEHSSYDWLIILGGAMNVDEEHLHPWLTGEKEFIAQALDKNKTILGICLGGQLIAEALGASVKKHTVKELGWHKVKVKNKSAFFAKWPEEVTLFHWHEYSFEIPSGTHHLAASTACENQAFSYGEKVLGLQFHPEVNEEWIETALMESGPKKSDAFVQSAAEILAKAQLVENNKQLLFSLLDALEKTI